MYFFTILSIVNYVRQTRCICVGFVDDFFLHLYNVCVCISKIFFVFSLRLLRLLKFICSYSITATVCHLRGRKSKRNTKKHTIPALYATSLLSPMFQVTLCWRFFCLANQRISSYILFLLLLLQLKTESRVNVFRLAHMFDINRYIHVRARIHRNWDQL